MTVEDLTIFKRVSEGEGTESDIKHVESMETAQFYTFLQKLEEDESLYNTVFKVQVETRNYSYLKSSESKEGELETSSSTQTSWGNEHTTRAENLIKFKSRLKNFLRKQRLN